MVALRAAAPGPEPTREEVLRDRGPPRRLVDPSARTADRVAVLRTRGALPKQDLDADEGRAYPDRRPRHARGGDPGTLRPGVPRPQGRVLGDAGGGGAHPAPRGVPPGARRRFHVRGPSTPAP